MNETHTIRVFKSADRSWWRDFLLSRLTAEQLDIYLDGILPKLKDGMWHLTVNGLPVTIPEEVAQFDEELTKLAVEDFKRNHVVLLSLRDFHSMVYGLVDDPSRAEQQDQMLRQKPMDPTIEALCRWLRANLGPDRQLASLPAEIILDEVIDLELEQAAALAQAELGTPLQKVNEQLLQALPTLEATADEWITGWKPILVEDENPGMVQLTAMQAVVFELAQRAVAHVQTGLQMIPDEPWEKVTFTSKEAVPKGLEGLAAAASSLSFESFVRALHMSFDAHYGRLLPLVLKQAMIIGEASHLPDRGIDALQTILDLNEKQPGSF